MGLFDQKDHITEHDVQAIKDAVREAVTPAVDDAVRPLKGKTEENSNDITELKRRVVKLEREQKVMKRHLKTITAGSLSGGKTMLAAAFIAFVIVAIISHSLGADNWTWVLWGIAASLVAYAITSEVMMHREPKIEPAPDNPSEDPTDS